MKKLIIILFTAFLFLGCEENNCECYYVTYDSDPTNNYVWTESYRSTWDASCHNELLDESTWTDGDGDKWYSKTKIECK